MIGSASIRAVAASAALLVLLGTRAGAQSGLQPEGTRFWVTAGGAIAAAALLDESARTFWLDRHSSFASSLADAGNFVGTGRNIIAGLAVTYVVARITHHRRTANAVLRISAGYAVSNVIVGVLKPVVGRHRPDSTNDAWRFKPFSTEGEWHSFPSSHAVHAFSIAAGAAIATRRSWVAALGYSAATVVAWSRVYDDQHWTSDVTTSAVIGMSAVATTMGWLDRRWPEKREPGTGNRGSTMNHCSGSRRPRPATRRLPVPSIPDSLFPIPESSVRLQPLPRIPVDRHRANPLELDARVVGLNEREQPPSRQQQPTRRRLERVQH